MHTVYLKENFLRKEQDRTIRDMRKLIKNKNIQFDGFLVTGVSGIIMGAIIARLCKKDLVVVRKKDESEHSPYPVENYNPDKKYIFLDDLIASGSTYRRCLSECKSLHDFRSKQGFGGYSPLNHSKVIGKLLYNWGVEYYEL